MYFKNAVLKKLGIKSLAILLTLGLLPTSSLMTTYAAASPSDIVNVTLNGNDIKANNVNGLTFKGFGTLSANGTSAVLMDYKSENPEAYQQLLMTMFGGNHPIMTNVKVEMGNDRNNSTGPDPCTMRTATEPADVTREPGFQLAADAKKINPNVKVSILRWNSPSWVKNNNDIYTWFKATILAAYRTYGYMVNTVNPGVNEQTADLTWTKTFANLVKTDATGFQSDTERQLFNQIQVVISDESSLGSFGGSMISDSALRDAVAIAGYHYNTEDDSSGNFKKLAQTYDKEIWNSEAQATFCNSAFRPNNNMADPTVVGTGIGGNGGPLEMANTIVKGFVNSNRTNFIYQPAIGSFYEGGQYSYKELVSARDPWSGWIHYDAALTILEHFSWFANTGWENSTNTAGIWRAVPQASAATATGTNPINGRNGLANYMTLAAPDKTNFSTVIVNDSEYTKTYNISATNMNFTGTPSLEIWETRAADNGTVFNSNYMQYRGDITPDANGSYSLTVKPYSIVTVTTLDCKDDPSYQQKLPVEGERTILDTDATGKGHDTTDNTLYADNFDYSSKTVKSIGTGGVFDGTESFVNSRGGDDGAIPLYTSDLNGAFESYKDTTTGNYVLRQQVDTLVCAPGSAWNNSDAATIIGDSRWMNYKASVDVSFEDNLTNNANYASIGARQFDSTSLPSYISPYLLKYWANGNWSLLVNGTTVASGNVVSGTGGVKIDNFNATYNAWHNIAIQVAGNTVTAYLDNQILASYTDAAAKLSGRVSLGSAYYYTDFDNLKIQTVDGYEPYYTKQLDNLEMKNLANPPKTELVYNSKWNHTCQTGMTDFQRTRSTSTGAGATLQYTFTGTGLDILGKNDGSAKVQATIDGVTMPISGTLASASAYQTFSLRGLAYGQHTVVVTLISGTLVVDSVSIAGGMVKGAPNTAALASAVNTAASITKLPSYYDANWAIFDTLRTQATTALADPAAYRLDQQGADQLTAWLVSSQNSLDVDPSVTSLASPFYLATFVGRTPTLPATVQATHNDSTTSDVPVKWNLASVNFNTPYQTVAVTGSYGSLQTTCYVEVVPKDILYFCDVGGTKANLGYDSPAYLAVQQLLSTSGNSLVNTIPDQPYSAETGWGYAGYTSSGATSLTIKTPITGTYSKQTTTGIYTANSVGANLTYSLNNLQAGNYTITLGTYSWWSSSARTEQVYLVYDGKSTLVDTITLNSSSYNVTKSYSFTLAQAGTAQIKLVATSQNQSPVLSFVGLTQTVSKTALQSLYTSSQSIQSNGYTTDSWTTFSSAMTNASTVLGDAGASLADVNAALATLQSATAGLVVDKAPLQSLYDTYKVKTQHNYTNSTWQALIGALTDGKTVLENTSATVSDVSGAISQIQTAIAGLQKNPLDTSALTRLLTNVSTKDQSLYTANSWAGLQQAITSANSVLADDPTQSQVDDAFYTLADAIDGLVYAPNKVALKAAIDIAGGIKLANYTQASADRVSSALNFAVSVNSDPNATQTQIDSAYNMLIDAVLDLALNQPDPDLLNAIAQGQKKNQSQYTAASWAALDAALHNALMVVADPASTSAQIATAKKDIIDAINGLAYKPDTKSLSSAIAQANTVDTSKFISSDVTAFQAALANAIAVLGNDQSTQGQVDTATTVLTTAHVALRLKADQAAIDALAAEIAAIDQSKYTDDSKAKIQALLAKVNALGSGEATETELLAVQTEYETLKANLTLISTTNTGTGSGSTGSTGSATTGTDSTQNPKTGDNGTMLWVMLTALCGTTVLVLRKRAAKK